MGRKHSVSKEDQEKIIKLMFGPEKLNGSQIKQRFGVKADTLWRLRRDYLNSLPKENKETLK